MSSALIALLLLLVGGFARADVYALVVNKENPLTSISKAAVLRIFKADTQHWEGGDPITLYLPKSQTKEKGFLLREVYQMTDEELKRYWTELVYRNKINEPPRAQSTGAVVVVGPVIVLPMALYGSVSGNRPSLRSESTMRPLAVR